MKSAQVIDHLIQDHIVESEAYHLNWPSEELSKGFIDNLQDRFLVLGRKAIDINGVSLESYLSDHENVAIPPGMPENWTSFGHLRKWEVFVSRHLFESMKDEIAPSPCSIEDSYSKGNGKYIVSISHSRGVIRVALGLRDQIKYLGIDVERVDRKALAKEDLWLKISTDKDRKLLADAQMDGLLYRSILFSTKESIYKYAYPFYGKYFGFQEAELVRVAEDHFIFKSHVLENIQQEQVRVNYQIIEDYVYSVALLTTS